MAAIPWRNNRTQGQNPQQMLRGINPYAARFFGFNAMGRAGPIQAPQDPGYEGPPFPLGQTYCMPEVCEWPFATDDAGLAFDVDNLYGIRGICYNDKANGNQESDDWWIAVPRTLPSGYTRMGRLLGDPFGFGGLIPNVNGNSYGGLRRPGNLFYPGPGRYDSTQWAPCNVSRQTYDASVDNYYDVWGTDGVLTFYTLQTIGPHCGFRDAKLELTALFPPDGPGDGSTVVSLYWDEPGTILDNSTTPPQLPAHLLYSVTVPYRSFVPVTGSWPGTGAYTINSIGSILQPKKYPVLHYIGQQNHGSGTGGPIATFRFGPRTDIPPHFACTTKNLYAPGGIPT
jgi:hypothetical protein